MESLALVVSMMVFICMFSGPTTLILTTRKFQNATEQPFLKALRRLIVGLINLFGIMICALFISGPIPWALKAVSLISLILNVWAVDREYGSFLTASLKKLLGKDPNGPAGQS